MEKQVLVVDDEKLIVKGIRFSLEQDGMKVDCAYDGEEALTMTKANTYDVILKQNTCYNEILNSGTIYLGNSADSIRVVSSYKIFLGDDCLYCSIADCYSLCIHSSYDVQIKSSRDVYACSFDTAITQIPTLDYDF